MFKNQVFLSGLRPLSLSPCKVSYILSVGQLCYTLVIFNVCINIFSQAHFYEIVMSSETNVLRILMGGTSTHAGPSLVLVGVYYR